MHIDNYIGYTFEPGEHVIKLGLTSTKESRPQIGHALYVSSNDLRFTIQSFDPRSGNWTAIIHSPEGYQGFTFLCHRVWLESQLACNALTVIPPKKNVKCPYCRKPAYMDKDILLCESPECQGKL